MLESVDLLYEPFPETEQELEEINEPIEMDADGEVVVEPPVSPESGISEVTISTAASVFRKAISGKEKDKKQLPRTGNDRIAVAYERRAEVESQKLEIMKDELLMKESFENRKLMLEREKVDLQRHEIQTKESREYQESTNRHKLEVAKLTGDPE